MSENNFILISFWEVLKSIRFIQFNALSHSQTGWNGTGEGGVSVEIETDVSCLFHEKGIWKGQESHTESTFYNVYRWTLKPDEGKIGLEHLRFGTQSPVFLFDLQVTGPGRLTYVEPHPCGEDLYFAHLSWNARAIEMVWRVVGLKKNEEIEYFYTK